MDAASLRAAQAPLKEKYQSDAASARQTLHARGEVDFASVAIRVEQPSRDGALGLHRATGGTGDFRCSGDMLLEALVGCAGTTLASVATVMAVPVERAAVLELTTSAPQETLDKLLALTERYCVVLQTMAQKPALSSKVVGSAEGGTTQSPNVVRV